MELWLKNLHKDIPTTIDPDMYDSLLDFFEDTVKKYSDQPAFVNMGESLTYRKIEERSRAFAAYLQSHLGLKKGDRVALMLPNILQYPIALFGILRAGMVVVNVNPLYTPRELLHQLKDSEAKAIIVVSNFASTVSAVIKETSVENVIITSFGDMLGLPKATIVNFVVKYIKKLVPKYNLPYAISFRKALYIGRRTQYVKPEVLGNDIAFLQYTGGTTGVSKGAMLSHRNIIANFLQADGAYAKILNDGKEVVITALPMYHIFALTVNCFFFMYKGSKNILIANPRDMDSFIKDLEEYKFSIIIGVNTLFNALLNDSRFSSLDFSNLKLTIGGGMAVQRSVATKWQEVTNSKLLEGYGLTEASPLLSCCPFDTEGYNGSIGFPVASTTMIVRDENKNILPINEIGEIWAKGPQVMLGYWQREEETANVIDEEGWLATGDLGYMDDKGQFFLVDRKKDMILVSGFNVFPNEIEDVVALHPKVLEVAAVGVENGAAGELVKIFIIKKDQSLTEKEIITHCKKNLTGYKVPKFVEFRTELPKSNVGKILRRELREKP